MLYVYNQSKRPWEAEIVREGTISLKKVKQMEVKQNADGEKDWRAVSIRTYEKTFGDVKSVHRALKAAVKTEDVVCVDNHPTGLIFGNKTFQPFIVSSEENIKDIFLATFELRGRKIVKIVSDYCFLLEYILFGGELSFVGTLNRDGCKFSVHLLDDAGIVTEYTFIRRNGIVEKIETTRQAGEDLKAITRVKRFRPANPTHTIIVHPNDKQALLDTLKDPEKHNIIEMSMRTTHGVVTALEEDNIRAVTLFANVPSTGDSTGDLFRKSKHVARILSKHFFTVFKLHSDKRVIKLQY